jgi:NhaP-type Na+/H+ or K+/H+ antiporter
LLLNVESGANDGLALPAVVVLATFVGQASAHPLELALSIPAGIALGIAVPAILLRVAYSATFGVSSRAEPLAPVAAAVLVFAIAQLTHANLYLAGFAAGITIGNLQRVRTDAFRGFADPTSELVKVVALFAFGALISWRHYVDVEPLTVFAFAFVVLFLVRPLVIFVTMIGSGLSVPELAIAAWFGPRGFASVVYGLYVLHNDGTGATRVFHLVALVVAASILLHSSTDVVAIRALRKRAEREEERSKHEEACHRDADQQQAGHP